jgi:chromosome segregation ATPase
MHVDIVLQDLLGNVVQSIGSRIFPGGEHSLAFTPSQNLASGIYIIEMRTSQGVKRIKVAIL